MEKNRERWLTLANLAVNEQDPKKFMDLIREINDLLEEKQTRLNNLRLGKSPDRPPEERA
jgi:hypothetical protein